MTYLYSPYPLLGLVAQTGIEAYPFNLRLCSLNGVEVFPLLTLFLK